MKQVIVVAVVCAFVAVPVRADLIIAQQEGDYQTNNNGHADTIGSGSWTYMYSNNINPMAGTTGLLT